MLFLFVSFFLLFHGIFIIKTGEIVKPFKISERYYGMKAQLIGLLSVLIGLYLLFYGIGSILVLFYKV